MEDLQRVVSRARELWESEVREMVVESQQWVRDVAELLNKEKALSGDAVRSLRVRS